jgi:dephospho-CoA kinase
MIVIGLAGRIGSGKSTVAARFASHGATVIDADRIAHETLDDADVRRELVERFGPRVLGEDGRIRRRSVAELVFGPTPEHARALEALEAVVHPRVRRRITADLAAARHRAAERGAGRDVVVLDVPLLVQSGWDASCDAIVVVECAEDVRRARLAARGWTPAQQADRDAAWDRKNTAAGLPADKILTVDASGDLAYTSAQVDRIWSGLSG